MSRNVIRGPISCSFPTLWDDLRREGGEGVGEGSARYVVCGAKVEIKKDSKDGDDSEYDSDESAI